MKKRFSNFFRKPLEIFIQTESSSSIILAVFALLALLLANSTYSIDYFHLLETKIFKLSLQHWINDGLMAIFFFMVGLEIKRELVGGELSTFRKAVLPVAAALGGMIAPALIYIYLNYESDYLNAWAIPMATDIAFALGVLALLGQRIPLALKIFLLALAIVDDLGAVLVIAFFYTEQIQILGLVIAAFAFGLVLISQYFNFRSYLLYILWGLITWFGFLYSGVHATIAGVIIGLLTPYSFTYKKNKVSITYSPIDDLIQFLHPWVSFGVMPLFALANTGITLDGVPLSEILKSTIADGVVLGLVFGKPIGIMLFSWLAVATGLAKIPSDLKWKHISGVSCLAGIGFTMSIFISNLALPVDKVLYAKVGIIIASVISGILGYCIIYFFTKKSYL